MKEVHIFESIVSLSNPSLQHVFAELFWITFDLRSVKTSSLWTKHQLTVATLPKHQHDINTGCVDSKHLVEVKDSISLFFLFKSECKTTLIEISH